MNQAPESEPGKTHESNRTGRLSSTAVQIAVTQQQSRGRPAEEPIAPRPQSRGHGRRRLLPLHSRLKEGWAKDFLPELLPLQRAPLRSTDLVDEKREDRISDLNRIPDQPRQHHESSDSSDQRRSLENAGWSLIGTLAEKSLR